MTKFTAPIHEPPPDPAQIARWNAKRREEHGVAKLDQGFSFRASGRDGFIYYREGDQLVEFYWEMSGVDAFDILLSLNGIREWALPSVAPIEAVKQHEILAAMQAWLRDKGIRAQLQDPRP